MYKIVGYPQTRAMRVIWLLEELGEPYEIDPVMPQSEGIRAVNLSGKVPVLIDDDLVLPESVAICTYLADKHGKFTYPAGTKERAIQDSFTQFAVDVLEGALWTAAKNSFIHPKDMRVPEIKPVCKEEFAAGLRLLEKKLGDGPFVMGETMTVPDILIGHCSSWALAAKFDLPKEGRIHDYFENLRKRPAHQAMMAKVMAAAA
jgi:glutathione S-transferase